MAKKQQELSPAEIDRQIQINHVMNDKNQIKIEQARVDNEFDYTLVEKVNSLGHLLTFLQPDRDNSMPGSEAKYKPLFDEVEVKIIKNKLFDIINKF